MLEDQQGKRFDIFFDRIKDIFRKAIKEKGIAEPTIIPVEYNGFQIDLPKKKSDIYHGSSYEILCDKPKPWISSDVPKLCKIKGDLVVGKDHEDETIKILERAHCKIFDSHPHLRESHLHFICQDRDSADTIRMINFLKDY
jgi:hypothetical protein